ncbi:acid-sensing ion channel 2 [Elysia marginata]|uniref:Acid-sensing ion channel 2 n=1 Tax=Elysia marginata TaxID=1093978 RepID=A0AAV4GY86_9GAST|nr:acid-sensing ion channel 2 [Elysia marginata]
MDSLNCESSDKAHGHGIGSVNAKSKQTEQDENQLFLLIFKDILKQYQETASIHGISRTLQPQAYSYRRFIWAVLVGVMAVLLGMTLYNLITDLSERPIKTVNKISLHDELPFPAVTICNMNQFIIDRVPDNPMIRHVLFYKSEYAGLGFSRGGMNDFNNLTDISGDELLRITHYAAPRLEELIWRCSWKSQDIDCKDIFQPVNTSYGKCYIFNADKQNVRKSKMSGFRESLKVMINIQNQKSFFSQYMEAGIFLLINEQGAMLVPQLDGNTIRPGVSAKIKLTRTDHIRLPFPYKAFSNSYCEDTEAENYFNKLSTNHIYSHTACQTECAVKSHIKHCGCKGFNDVGDFPICSVKQYLTCYVRSASTFSQAELIACGCREQCKTVSYELEVFYADFASTFIQEAAIQDKLTIPNNVPTSFIEATIFFKSLHIQTLEQQPAISMADIIGKVGGQMGLFLGVSLLSYVEIVEAILLLLYNYFLACKARLSCKVRHQARVPATPEVSQASFVSQETNKMRQLVDPLDGLTNDSSKRFS